MTRILYFPLFNLYYIILYFLSQLVFFVSFLSLRAIILLFYWSVYEGGELVGNVYPTLTCYFAMANVYFRYNNITKVSGF